MSPADLTCETCDGAGWYPCPSDVPDCIHRCAACDEVGRRRPELAEWDALVAERDKLRETLQPFARMANHTLATHVSPFAADDDPLPSGFQLPPGYTTVGDLRWARAALDRETSDG